MKNKAGDRMWLTPILLALPTALVVGLGAVRYGETIKNLIHLAIKLVVTK